MNTTELRSDAYEYPRPISLEEDMAAVITMLRLAVDRDAPLTCRELDKLADRICGWDCVLGEVLSA